MLYGPAAGPRAQGFKGEAEGFEALVRRAADGNRLAARVARPAVPSGAGVVICPDVRGLHNFYKDLCCRFAEAGIDAVAIDYFGRTAGMGERTDAFEYRPHVAQTTKEGVSVDVGAGVRARRSV